MTESLREKRELFIVRGTDGKTASFGWLQAEWLRDNGHIVKLAPPHLWQAKLLGAFELDALCREQRHLLTCDFCTVLLAMWLINLRSPVTLPGMPGSPQGPIDRPMYACDGCADLIRANRRRELVENAIASVVADIRDRGMPTPTYRAAMAEVGPKFKYVADEMFRLRRGFPERIDR